MSDFATALVNAFMGPGQSPTDEQGNVDPALYYTYKSLVDITSKTARDFRAQETRAYIAELQNNVKVYNSAQKAMTDLVGYRTQAAIASARNITAIKVAAQKTADSLTKMLSTKSEDKINKIEQIAERNAASGNTNMGQEVARAMLNESYESVDGINPDRTTKLATQNELLIKHVGTNFNDPNFSQKLDQVLAGAQDAGRVKERLLAQQTQWLNVNKVIADAHGLQGTVENYSNMVKDIQPGAPGSEEAIKQANAILLDALEKNQDLMTMRGERTQSALQEAQGWYSQYMTEVAKYEPVMQDIARRMMQQDQGKNNRAQLVNSENFQKWAQSNGFANTGYIQDGVYVEGADDTDAIALWLWQRKHPGKYRPGLIQPPSDTGQVLKIEQPLSEEAAAKFYNEDGQYLARSRGKELSYLTKDDPLLQLANEGGLVVDTGDKTFVVKQSKVASKALQDELVGLTNDKALIEQTLTALEKSGASAEDIETITALYMENDAQRKQLDARLKEEQAGAREVLTNKLYLDELKKPVADRRPDVINEFQEKLAQFGVYEVDLEGNIKKLEGPEITAAILGDEDVIDLKTEELKGRDLVNRVSPELVKTEEAPVKTVYAREQVLHANDIQRGQINQKLKVYDHELRDPVDATFNFDPKTGNATVVDSVDETLNGKKFQPEQAYGAGKARETEEKFVDDSKLGRKPRGKSDEEKALKDEEKAALAAARLDMDPGVKENKLPPEQLEDVAPQLTAPAQRKASKEQRIEQGQANLERLTAGGPVSGVQLRSKVLGTPSLPYGGPAPLEFPQLSGGPKIPENQAARLSYKVSQLTLPTENGFGGQQLNRSEPVEPQYTLSKAEFDSTRTGSSGQTMNLEGDWGVYRMGTPAIVGKSFGPGTSPQFKTLMDMYSKKKPVKENYSPETVKSFTKDIYED